MKAPTYYEKRQVQWGRFKSNPHIEGCNVHIHLDKGDNWEIAQYIQKRETSKRGIPVPSFAYATEGVDYGAEDKLTVQSGVGRYKQMAQQIIENVCEGSFP